MTDMQSLAQSAVLQYFPSAYPELSHAERAVFLGDVLEVAEAEDLTLDLAAHVMRTRLGGEKNLRPYMDCLMVGQGKVQSVACGLNNPPEWVSAAIPR